MKVLLLTYAEVPDDEFDMTVTASLVSVIKDLVSSALEGSPGATCLRVSTDDCPTTGLLQNAAEGVAASMTRASLGDLSVKVGVFTVGPVKES